VKDDAGNKEKTEFAKRLIQLRKDSGMIQDAVAERLGISRGRYSNYEQGTREPDFATVITLAGIFNVSTDYLLGTSHVKTPITTIAAHRTDDPMKDLPPEAQRSVDEFIELMKIKYGKPKE